MIKYSFINRLATRRMNKYNKNIFEGLEKEIKKGGDGRVINDLVPVRHTFFKMRLRSVVTVSAMSLEYSDPNRPVTLFLSHMNRNLISEHAYQN